jgi:hypothetical protein
MNARTLVGSEVESGTCEVGTIALLHQELKGGTP